MPGRVGSMFLGSVGAGKCLLTLLAIAGIGYADLVSCAEISFSIFYLLPIAYATFIRAKAGMLTALICATIWFVIAQELGISPKTVETYRENLKKKLGAVGQPLPGAAHR